jgi:hypothetical protein
MQLAQGRVKWQVLELVVSNLRILLPETEAVYNETPFIVSYLGASLDVSR